MVERERQAAQRLCKRACARFVAAPGTVLDEGHCFLQGQHVKGHLVRPTAPVGKTRRDQNPRAGCGQEIGNLLGRCHIVVDEKPDFSLLGEPSQCRLGGFLDVGLLGRSGREL